MEQSLAVVVGAGGMGMAVARRLGERYRLILADRDAAHLDAKIAALKEEGHDAIPAVCDVTDPKAVAAMAEEARAKGPLRVLAHVVGLSPSMGDWRSLMSVNLVGARLVNDALLPLAEPGTAAVFVASIAGFAPNPSAEMIDLLDQPLAPDFLESFERVLGRPPNSLDAYAHSKFALIRMCERLAPAWGRRGARIVSIAPGLISTPMGDLEFKNLPAKFDMLARTPIQRQGSMLEIADAIDFLTSDRASFISGTNLLVDGGLTAANRHPDMVKAADAADR